MEKLIREFLEYIELERGHSQLTIRNYDSYLSKFAEFAEDQGITSVQKIDLELIKKWRLTLHRRGLQNKTMNYYMISIRSFLKYLSKLDIESLAPEKIELADTPERSIAFLEPEELERIRQSYKDRTRLELRNRAVLEVLFSTSVRVSELVGLNRDQINIDHEEFSVDGKGGKLRVVFLSGEAKVWVKKYLEARHDRDKALFIKEAKPNEEDMSSNEMKDSGGRLTTRQIERVVQEAAKRAGIVKKVTPHVLRHSFATDILRAGADLRSVQSLLGHSSITTTQVYTHVTDKHLHEIHRKFHNKNKLEDNKEDADSH